jgi:hypothetical protein
MMILALVLTMAAAAMAADPSAGTSKRNRIQWAGRLRRNGRKRFESRATGSKAREEGFGVTVRPFHANGQAPDKEEP